ncbi:MAG: phosphoribosylamine--glycine ligase [Candidatus Omnitrophota bacterium]
MMKVLVIGQGGREHAIAWKIKQSPRVKKLYCAPGNGGTAGIATNIPVKADDAKGLCDFCRKEKIDLTVVGPEAPLASGIVDLFKKRGLRIFGPAKASAQLEGSKVFMKELCRDEDIPTADFEIFSDAEKAKDFIKGNAAPVVVKADGLAAGKGVIVAKTEVEALGVVDKIMIEKVFGSSGDRVIIEECLEGEEASIIVVSDGENVVPLASSQDHKRIFDNDKGPNTGGMGAYSPAPLVTDEIFDKTISKIIMPAIRGMKKKGTPHKGVLYAGIMISDGEPKLLEFNVRLGDPETQVVLPRLNSRLLELIESATDGSLKDYSLNWSGKSCVCVVMASGGYPGKYEKGKEISGIEKALELEDTIVFHAGTTYGDRILTNGGRVLNVVALGEDLKEAIDKAYKACSVIKFEGVHYRKDIGHKALMLQN